jgi:4-hydroxy-3-polyprenylbenzoate decarboxylase
LYGGEGVHLRCHLSHAGTASSPHRLDGLLHASYAQNSTALNSTTAAAEARIGSLPLAARERELSNLRQNLVIATTGASGAPFLRSLLQIVDQDSRIASVNFIASDGALRVMAEELGLKGRADLVAQLLGRASGKIRQQANADLGANVASGSYPGDAMIVLPCSVGTLARIASGVASRLIERAADVCLKEKRPLVLCLRETPLNKIHIRNMYRVADAGATVFPLIPAYYFRPATLEQMAHEFACRVLAHIGLPQKDAYRWQGSK